MEVKEAIKFLNKDKSSMAYPWDDKIQNWQDRIVVINQVISLLKRGEAYEEIVEELYVIHGNTRVDEIGSLSDVIEILEQKYLKEERK